jgi:hypothetical protein
VRRALTPPPLTVKNYQAALQRFTSRVIRRRMRDLSREQAHADGYRSVSRWERSGRKPRPFPLGTTQPFTPGDQS